MAKRGFSKKGLIIVFSLATVSLLISILLSIFKVELEAFDSSYANIYSRSAVGHKAFRTLLKKMDIPVTVSNFSSGSKAKKSGLLLLIEPHKHFTNPFKKELKAKEKTLADILKESKKSLVVLPKWRVVFTLKEKNWVDSVDYYEQSVYDTLFNALGLYNASTSFITHRPDEWDSPFTYAPNIQTMQLVHSENITPIISCNEGILLGKSTASDHGKEVYILSDPDLLSNYNITRGDNGILTMDIIEYLREGKEGVIIDEMMHGFVHRKSIWRMLFDFPFITLLISALLAAGIALWAGLIRTQKAETDDEKIEWGKAYLVGNSAHLITMPKHRCYVLERYFRNALYAVSKQLSIKCDINNREAMVDILAKQTKSSQLYKLEKEIEAFDMKNRISSEQMTHLAQKIYRWKERMTNGTR